MPGVKAKKRPKPTARTDNPGGQERLKKDAQASAKLSAPAPEAPHPVTPVERRTLALADLQSAVKSAMTDKHVAEKRIGDAHGELRAADMAQKQDAIRDVRTAVKRFGEAEATGEKALTTKFRVMGKAIVRAVLQKAVVRTSKDKSKVSLRSIARDALDDNPDLREHYASSKNPVGALTTQFSRARSCVEAIGLGNIEKPIWDKYSVRDLSRFGSFARRDVADHATEANWQRIGTWAGEKRRTASEIKERYPASTYKGADVLAKAIEKSCVGASAWLRENGTHPDATELVSRAIRAVKVMIEESAPDVSVTVSAKAK